MKQIKAWFANYRKRPLAGIGLLFASLAASPSGATLIAFLTIIAGLVGSLYTQDIKDSFPFATQHNPPAPVRMFWGIVLAVSVLFILRQRRVDAELREARDKLLKGVSEVNEAVTTMPPVDFLYQMRVAYEDCEKILLNAQDLDSTAEGAVDTLQQAIRGVLHHMTALASKWGGQLLDEQGELAYRANIMLYQEVADVKSEADRQRIWDASKKFLPVPNFDAAVNSFDGFLVVDPALTGHYTPGADPEKAEPDDTIQELALPVTLASSLSKWDCNLPGAPLAYVQSQDQWVQDTAHIPKICEAKGQFNQQALSKIAEYYKQDEKGRSIFSAPLIFRDSGPDTIAIGVVNIYRNRPNILKSESRARQFGAVLAPFVSILVGLVTALIDAEHSSMPASADTDKSC